MIAHAEMLTTDEREALLTLGSGQISDAMESLDLRRSVIVGLTYLAPAGQVIVGTAITIRQATKHGSAKRSDRLVRHGELSAETAQPGQVICMDAGGRVDVASWGENHSYRCLARGVAGLVTNGATRDVAAIRKSGFPVFCGGFSPVKSQWDLETAAIGEPVTIGNVNIRSSDIVFGDEDGVIVIPYAIRAKIIDLAMAVRQKENSSAR